MLFGAAFDFHLFIHFKVWNTIKRRYFISDEFIWHNLASHFCRKNTTHPGDLEYEVTTNGFGNPLQEIEGRIMSFWRSDKWAVVFF